VNVWPYLPRLLPDLLSFLTSFRILLAAGDQNNFRMLVAKLKALILKRFCDLGVLLMNGQWL
jgi:hypothetical protein